jgi:molybdenum cofactor biosynthesis protein B
VATVSERAEGLPDDARARVVTVSDRSHGGLRHDRSGPAAVEGLRALGFAVEDPVVVPDDVGQVQEALRAAVRAGVDVVLTTGGTGLSPRDVTPEATRALLEREAPGIGEALRRAGADTVPTAVLSRGVAGTVGRTFVVKPARQHRRRPRRARRARTAGRPPGGAAARRRRPRRRMSGSAPGWPARLEHGAVGVRPLRLRDAATWVEVRRRNRAWLAPWEGRSPTSADSTWDERHTGACSGRCCAPAGGRPARPVAARSPSRTRGAWSAR